MFEEKSFYFETFRFSLFCKRTFCLFNAVQFVTVIHQSAFNKTNLHQTSGRKKLWKNIRMSWIFFSPNLAFFKLLYILDAIYTRLFKAFFTFFTPLFIVFLHFLCVLYMHNLYKIYQCNFSYLYSSYLSEKWIMRTLVTKKRRRRSGTT